MKKINLKKGFTLIELMIVVAIIGILAAIAIPNFIRYQLRSKSAEAKTVMGGVKTSQESFRAEYDTYVAEAASNPNIGIRGFKTQWTVSVCANTCNRVSISANGPGECPTWECIGYRPAGDVYYEYFAAVTDPTAGAVPEWTMCASADLDTDTTPGGFVYGTANDPASNGLVTVADPGGCDAMGAAICAAGTAPGSTVVDCDPQNF